MVVLETLADRVDELTREVEALTSLADDRARRIVDSKAALTEERLRGIWLDGEVARRDETIGRLLEQLAARDRSWRVRWPRRLVGWLRRGIGSRSVVARVSIPSDPASTPEGPPALVPLEPADVGREGSTVASPPAPRPPSVGGPSLAVVRVGESIETGAEYLVMLGPGDELAVGALDVLSSVIVERGGPDLVCGDGDGGRHLPGWSPDLLLATMEPDWVVAVRRERFEAVGGFRDGFDGRAALHDLALRLTDDPAATVAHVPFVVNRRGDSTAAASEREASLGSIAVDEALGRRGLSARAIRPSWAVRAGRPVFELVFPDDGPRAAIVIPTRNRVDLLERCVGSVLARTLYRNFRVVVVDDRSDDPATLARLKTLADQDGRCRVVRRDDDGRPFSYARVNNEAVGGLDEGVEFVVFLNDDTEVRRPDWLSALVGRGLMPGVGAVGARLLYPDGRVQHAGMIADLHDGMPGHAFKLAPWWADGPLGLARVARACSAVTAACLATRRSTFLDLGGFDEERFAVAYNDLDYCLRLGEKGLRTVHAPEAELLHFEGATRGFVDEPAETAAHLAKWGGRPDPYRNPNWTPGDERLGTAARSDG